MVQVLPYVPSFGEKLVPALTEAGSNIAKGIEKRQARTALESFLNPQSQQSQQQVAGQQTPGQPGSSPLSMVNAAAPSFNPGKGLQAYGLAEKIYGPEGAKLLAQGINKQQELQYQTAEKQQERSEKRIEKAEPILQEREDKLNTYEQEGLRFDRLQNLFSPELESKFPPSFAVGLMTKDGELRPTAAATLSPEAQEAVKLIVDNLKGAKDTFGSRVTNFDAQTYLKTLPGLLNTPDGRRRVLRDLRIMNKLNTQHEQGVLNIVEREGGPSNISISQAERRYKKENAEEIKKLKEEFVNPDKNVFSDIPDATLYPGRSYLDEETGERFKSNGKEWIPE